MENHETARRWDEKSADGEGGRGEKGGAESRRCVRGVKRTRRGNEPSTMTITSRKDRVYLCALALIRMSRAHCCYRLLPQREDDLGPRKIKTRLCVVESAGIRILFQTWATARCYNVFTKKISIVNIQGIACKRACIVCKSKNFFILDFFLFSIFYILQINMYAR